MYKIIWVNPELLGDKQYLKISMALLDPLH